MPTPEHRAYRKTVQQWCRAHADDPQVIAEIEQHDDVLMTLWELDLEPARDVLQRCYASSPRGGTPRDCIVMMRCFLTMLLARLPRVNAWPGALSGSRVLRLAAGLNPDDPADRPGVGTFYDLMHRLHDGPQPPCRCGCSQRPSAEERGRTRVPRPRQIRSKAPVAADKNTPDDSATGRLVAALEAAGDQPNPTDLLARLSELLLKVAVNESSRRALLGDPEALVVGGDGSPLVTGASGMGKRVCEHGRFDKCDCPKLYADPDASWGWDSHRKRHFFGEHFYEISCSFGGHDLPLALRVDPGNSNDFVPSLRCFERLRKDLRQHDTGLRMGYFLADAGHDCEHNYAWPLRHGVTPVISLGNEVPRRHPRQHFGLSKRGVPMCEGGAEMIPGGSAEPGRMLFKCACKSRALTRCPKAPDDDPTWVCRPDLKVGPTVTMRTLNSPRLFGPLARNSSRWAELYKLRSGCERSNAVKKERFKLEDARHRRASFWLIRLHLIAMLQHARAWVVGRDRRAFVNDLLGRTEVPLAA